MAPCKPAKSLKVRVPRQNAQRLGPSLTAEVHAVGRLDNVIVHLPPPVQEQPSSAGPSSENASEWNSLLISARAQRGPFWDVGTQQFLVEKESELYYNPTLLLESARSLTNGGTNTNASGASSNSLALQHAQQQQQQQQQQEQQRRNNPYPYPNQVHGPHSQHPQYPYPNQGGMSTPVTNHTSPARGHNQGQSQFYGDAGTPTRPGMGGGMTDGVSPAPDVGYGRRITRGMSYGDQGYGN